MESDGVRVYELAKELGVPSKTVLAKLGSLGYSVRSSSVQLEDAVVDVLRGQREAPISQKHVGAETEFKCGCCKLVQKPHLNHLGIRDRICAGCLSHQGDADSAQAKRAQQHEAMLRERLKAAKDAANLAYAARNEYREKMRSAYSSRERAASYLSKINNLHELRPSGACSCGVKKGCKTAALIYEPWVQQMIHKIDRIEADRRRERELDPINDWDDEP